MFGYKLKKDEPASDTYLLEINSHINTQNLLNSYKALYEYQRELTIQYRQMYLDLKAIRDL